MNYVLAVFRSRTQTRYFAELFAREGRAVRLVPTPSAAKVGCGISAKISYGDVPLARRIISVRGLNAFYGFFEADIKGGITVIKRVR